jgi:hypothetical protein
MKSPGLVCLGAFAGGLGLGWMLSSMGSRAESPAALSGSGAPIPPASTGATDRDLDGGEVLGAEDLTARLSRMEAQLVALSRTLDSLAESNSPRRPGNTPTEALETTDLSDQVAQLQASVDKLLLRDGDRVARMELLRREHPDSDWAELGTLVGAWQLDEKAAARSLHLQSDERVLEQFGAPTEMWSNDGGVHWVYGEGKDPITEKYLREIYFCFRDGHVTLVNVTTR